MALSTFTDLKTELANRGFDYLTSTQQGDYINIGYNALCSVYEWPFLEATSTTLTSGTSLSDLDGVLSVYDPTEGSQLAYRDRRELVSDYGALTDTGAPAWWYLEGQTTIKTFPVDAARQLTVVYKKVPTALSGGSDTPLIPSQWRRLIVDRAVVEALKEKGSYQEAKFALDVWQTEVDRMVLDLTQRNMTATPEYIVQTHFGNF